MSTLTIFPEGTASSSTWCVSLGTIQRGVHTEPKTFYLRNNAENAPGVPDVTFNSLDPNVPMLFLTSNVPNFRILVETGHILIDAHCIYNSQGFSLGSGGVGLQIGSGPVTTITTINTDNLRPVAGGATPTLKGTAATDPSYDPDLCQALISLMITVSSSAVIPAGSYSIWITAATQEEMVQKLSV